MVHPRLQFNSFHRSIFKEKPVRCSLFSDRFSVGDSHARQHKTSSRNLAHGEDNNYCYESLIRIQFSWRSKPCPSKHYNAIKGHSLQNFCWHKCADPDGCFGYDEAWSRFGKNFYTIFCWYCSWTQYVGIITFCNSRRFNKYLVPSTAKLGSRHFTERDNNITKTRMRGS